jgi:rubrerythrin
VILKIMKNSQDESLMRLEIPKELNQAIIRIQAAEDLDFIEACRRAATLVDPRREEFQKAVQDEADRLAKSRFMSQINKARTTIGKQEYQRGYNEGLRQYTYTCNVCRGTIYATKDNEWKWILEKGYLSTWGHAECHEKQGV